MPKLKPGTVWPQPAKVNLTGKEIEEIAVGPMTYGQIEEKYGEEVAIDVGIARDPDAKEWTEEDFARALPAAEIMPQIVQRWHQDRAGREALA